LGIGILSKNPANLLSLFKENFADFRIINLIENVTLPTHLWLKVNCQQPMAES